MCVLTYVPYANGRFALTHNRDESTDRPRAIPPRTFLIDNEAVTYPQDPESRGTWLAHDRQWVACLLNGGFVGHTRKASYRRSRGTIIPTFFEYRDLHDFLGEFDPYELEPFTLVLYHAGLQSLDQITWDEQVLHLHHLAADQPHIWSSSTLYSPDVKANRVAVFERLLAAQPDAQAIFDFHRLHQKNDPNEHFFVKIGEKIKTVAIAQVLGYAQRLELRYETFY
jgi:uncharacterized protein with NRDE domain